jgi:hypothetical protein
MVGRNMNVYFQEETYSKIKSLVAKGELSRFINEAVEKKLVEKQQQNKEELRQKIIEGYKANAKNKKLQTELKAMEATSIKDVFTMLEKRENEQRK